MMPSEKLAYDLVAENAVLREALGTIANLTLTEDPEISVMMKLSGARRLARRALGRED